MAGIDLNRGSAGVNLPASVSNDIFGAIVEESAVMQIARKIDLPGNGTIVHIATGEPVAEFVEETALKPVSSATVTNQAMKAHTIAVIETFSNQFKRDLAGLYAELVRRLPLALGKAFDAAALHGINAPATGWSDLSSVTATTGIGTPADAYGNMVDALATIGNAGHNANGIIVAPTGEASLLKATVANTGLLFNSDPSVIGGVGSVLGRPVLKTRSATHNPTDPSGDTLGYLGDWTAAAWGSVEGVQIHPFEGTLQTGPTATDLTHLFQRNMFALRCEIDVGFVVTDPSAFVRLTGATSAD